MKKEHPETGTGIKYALICIALVSCSMLMYEVLLTRICALRFEFHFSFLIVSNCLLGIGASGSMIFLMQKLFAKDVRRWTWIFTLLYLISLLLTYSFLITYDVNFFVNFQSWASILKFTIFNIIATVPFFFAGGVIGLILTFNAEQVNKVYFFDLLGASLGCLFCPFFLWQTGAGGCFIFLALLSITSIMVTALPAFKRKAILAGIILGLVAVLILPEFDNWFPVPSKIEIAIDKDYWVNIRENRYYSRWSPTSRVDLVNIMPDKRILLGVSGNKPLPEEKFILQDGSAGTFILNFSENPDSLKILNQSLYSLAFMLKNNPRVFVIGVGGGNDVWAAKLNGAKYIKGIELNRQILDIHNSVLSSYSKNIINDPNIDLVFDEGRSALIRDTTRYDVIQMTGVDTWTSLTSGAYVLAENYLYTTESLKNMYGKLTDGGIISITRLALDVETLRLFSNIFAALDNQTDRSIKFENSVVCIGAGLLRTILIKKGEFNADELGKLERISNESGFGILYFPKRTLGNVLEGFIRSNEKQQFIKLYPRDISPTPDNRPYFFNYTKWNPLLKSSQYLAEPTFASQGNPMFILGQLIVSTIFAFIFILLPLVVLRKEQINRLYIKRFFLYFMGLGLGFISIEIVLIQKLVLFLGHPIYSLTVTIFSMLIFTGIGSLFSGRWFYSPTTRAWVVPLGLSVLLGLFIWLSPVMVQSLIIWPRTARILFTVLILAPIGLLLGVPFAYGIQLLNRFNPSIIPWAWAVNGCFTVIGSILAVILSMNFGFNAVLITAILVYWLSFFSIHNLKNMSH
jgi:hypothetical protein